ncbi:hypothetical protein C6P45_002862 [Maudiozyma exigua]|uniref:Uncharacterized protein n=1 Tax=Maudiozyma exigua TaxID=34358 RepID=A0A9P7BCQ2_MAUEX|nr:hypothetical protein C6P45_002862 [Kazachstania exigua]
MDEHTKLRVFEPLDTNSLSIISSASSTNLSGLKSNGNSFMGLNQARGPTTPTLPHNDENCNGMLQWKLEKKDFLFNSNSTPSKKRHGNSFPERTELLQVKKRRSQLIGAKKNKLQQLKLNHTTSKLDLLEVDKITTLPLIPPPQSRHNLSNSYTEGHRSLLNHYEPDNDTVQPVICSTGTLAKELRIHNKEGKRHISYSSMVPLMSNTNSLAEQEHEDNNNNQDEDEDEDDQPIVMIEDYIPYNERQSGTKKRVSMSDLRTKMDKRRDSHIPLKLKKSIREINGLTTVNENGNSTDVKTMVNNLLNPIDHYNKMNVTEYGDKYLTELGVSSSVPVKKCVICERPLYEVMNILAYHQEPFKEIVCENCTYAYERASKLFETCEFETSGESNNNSSFMSDLETSLDATNVIVTTTRATSNNTRDSKFSKELIELLKLQAQQPCLDEISMDNHKPNLAWFLEARDKLQNEWQTNGLIPFFMRRLEK